MRRRKMQSFIVLFVVTIATLAISLGDFIRDQVNEIERTKASRSRIQAQIHESIHGSHPAQIRDARLISRCGITAYAATLTDVHGNEFTLYYDINTGAPVRQDLLSGCSARVPGYAAGLALGSNAGVNGPGRTEMEHSRALARPALWTPRSGALEDIRAQPGFSRPHQIRFQQTHGGF